MHKRVLKIFHFFYNVFFHVWKFARHSVHSFSNMFVLTLICYVIP